MTPHTRRVWIAFFFHVPGLRLLIGRDAVPAGILRANLLAAGLTVVAILLASRRGWRAALGAWIVGHVIWGAILARRVSGP